MLPPYCVLFVLAIPVASFPLLLPSFELTELVYDSIFMWFYLLLFFISKSSCGVILLVVLGPKGSIRLPCWCCHAQFYIRHTDIAVTSAANSQLSLNKISVIRNQVSHTHLELRWSAVRSQGEYRAGRGWLPAEF